jgi:hypothetical protein
MRLSLTGLRNENVLSEKNRKCSTRGNITWNQFQLEIKDERDCKK